MDVRRKLVLQLLSQNVRGLDEDAGQEVPCSMVQKGIFCYAVQEPRRAVERVLQVRMLTMTYQTVTKKSVEKKGRLSGGLALLLSPQATAAWTATGGNVT